MMAKLTRAERAAAGWTLCWGLYDHNDGRWKQSPRDDEGLVQSGWCAIGTGRAHNFATSTAASNYADEHAVRNGIVPRPFWRRTRPKPATGEAIVRVRVSPFEPGETRQDGRVRCWTNSREYFWLKPEDIEPAEATR